MTKSIKKSSGYGPTLTVEDMKDTLTGVARAVDKDTLTIINHERRIRHLEKAHV